MSILQRQARRIWGALLPENKLDIPSSSILEVERSVQGFARLNTPSTADTEAWRYTSLKGLQGPISSGAADVEIKCEAPSITLRSLSDLLAGSKTTVEEEALAWVKGQLNQVSPLRDLHTLYLQEAYILIASASDDESKVIINHRRNDSAQGYAVGAPSVWVYVQTGAQVSLEEHFSSPSTGGGATLSLTGVKVEAGAHLTHMRAQVEGVCATSQGEDPELNYHLGLVSVDVCRQGQYDLSTLNLGANIARVELEVSLLDEEAEARLNGVYVGSNKAALDQHLTLKHQAPCCRSTQRFRGVLGGSSKGVFTGRVIVSEGAHSTLAEQNNPNLVVSDQAKVVTRPQLEIYNDDVECSHGATVGQLDEDALFYLRARGLSEEVARRALTSAFVSEVREKLPGDDLRLALDRSLSMALNLPEGDAVSDAWLDWETIDDR